MSPERKNAGERRDEVLRIAAGTFAEGGYKGTSTEDIAKRAGISQPYIFRLFGSKRELFIAVVNECFERTIRTFERAASGLSGEEALMAMGLAYEELVRDPAVLLVELHAFTASVDDPKVREAAQKGMRRIWRMAAETSGLDAEDLRHWLSMGMLLNVVAALGLEQLDEQWAREVCPPDKHQPRTPASTSAPVGHRAAKAQSN